ncbi:unnamed protein product [Meganyctiphanes norvegica]|uniref:Uncharacterized protein n=1 Tax=Meganyctiphanes norvegica TaxID=48144 RepID=A0AAV2RB48_MEGNR
MQKLSLVLVCVVGLVLLQETTSEEVDVPSPDGFSFATLPAMKWLNSLTSGDPQEVHSRKKRSLLLPTGSSMEVKWSVNFPFDTFTSYKAKVQLALPIKIPFPEAIVKPADTGRSDTGFSGGNDLQAYGPQYNDYETQYSYHQRRRRQARQERHGIYEKLQAAFGKAGVNGRHCLLRTICDVAEAPFEQGILGEMLNVMLTASLAGRPDHPDETKEYDEYIEAELHGKLNGKCEERYSKCKKSPFDLIPQVTQQIFHI